MCIVKRNPNSNPPKNKPQPLKNQTDYRKLFHFPTAYTYIIVDSEFFSIFVRKPSGMTSHRLKEYIEHKNISYYAFENSVGAGRGAISKAVKEGKSLGSKLLERIFEIYPDLNPNWLLTGKSSMLNGTEDAATASNNTSTSINYATNGIPLFNLKTTDGLQPILAQRQKVKPEAFISIPNMPKCDGAVEVFGDTMYPLLKRGDIVLFKRLNHLTQELFWGELYLMSIENNHDEFITLRYVQQGLQPNTITLVSENKHYQDKEISLDKINGMALVKANIRINTP